MVSHTKPLKLCTITLQIGNRTKVNNSFRDFIDLLLGVPQGSILGLLLFNIYICDLFLFVEEDVTSYADDTTPYSNGKNVVTLLENIETKGKELFNGFSMNYLKASYYGL